MNYWDDLKNRSIFLWRSLFGEEENEDREQPVYIDRAAAAQTAAAQKELLYTLRSELNDRETEGGDAAAAALYDAAIRTDRTAAGQALRGLPDAEKEREESAGSDDAASQQEHRTRSGSTDDFPPKRTDIPGAGAELLLTGLREADFYERRLREMPADSAETAAPSMNGEPVAAPVDISAWFEKDARRYDGAYEVM